jgi:membrane protein
VSVSLGLTAGVPGASDAILWIAPLLLTVEAFALLYFAVPGTAVEPSHALVGGVVAGALFELMKRGFAIYVSHVPTYTMVYGAFATVPLFLLWIYLSWVVTALGAVVTALLPDLSDPKGDQPWSMPAVLK